MVETKDIFIFDRAQLRRNRMRSSPKLSDHAFLLDWTRMQLEDNISMVNRGFSNALYIGNERDAKKLSAYPKIKNFVHSGSLQTLLSSNISAVVADEELLPFADQSFDLALGNLSLHSINDLPGTLAQIRRVLKPDGLFLSSMFGGETLHELRASLMQAEVMLKGGASPRVFPFADKQQMAALMQRAGFALPVISSEIVTVTYETIFKLMHDLRFMGEGNIIRERSMKNPGKALFMEAARYYHEHFGEKDGRIPASFEIIFLSGWSPDQSQQQPLKPGSAKHRLADALQTAEIKTGEKALP